MWNEAIASLGCTNRAEMTSCPPSGVGKNCFLSPDVNFPDEGAVCRNVTKKWAWKRLCEFSMMWVQRKRGTDRGTFEGVTHCVNGNKSFTSGTKLLSLRNLLNVVSFLRTASRALFIASSSNGGDGVKSFDEASNNPDSSNVSRIAVRAGEPLSSGSVFPPGKTWIVLSRETVGS